MTNINKICAVAMTAAMLAGGALGTDGAFARGGHGGGHGGGFRHSASSHGGFSRGSRRGGAARIARGPRATRGNSFVLDNQSNPVFATGF